MGQYWIVTNHTKREFLNPHKFGDGLKFREFAGSGSGTLAGLAYLLADPSSMGEGGGDMKSAGPSCGKWIGNNIEISGDYSHKRNGDPANVYTLARESYTDISDDLVKEMNANCPSYDPIIICNPSR